MKLNHFISAIFAAVLAVALPAQTIPNGGFENWTTISFETPHFYSGGSNYDVLKKNLPVNVTKVADPQLGSFAIKMETVTNGSDTMFGYFINGDPQSGAGGIPYNQHPVTLTGFYKSTIPAGDSAIILVFFKQGGTVVSMDVAHFTGTHSAYTPFTMTLSIPMAANPDTVLIGAASSNAMMFNGIPGSIFQLDNLSFTGVTSQPAQLNGSFESWDPHTIYQPAQWGVHGDTLTQTTDAHSGTYALELKTYLSEDNIVNREGATNGVFPPNSGADGGRPFTQMNDTLHFWYKYTPNGSDNGYVQLTLTQNGSNVGGTSMSLAPALSYMFISIPITASIQPDTLLLEFSSSTGNPTFSNVGSTLKVDDVYMQSSPLGNAEYTWSALSLVQLVPNPAANGSCILQWNSRDKSPVTITVLDVCGKIVLREAVAADEKRFVIDTTKMPGGIYSVNLLQGENRVSRKLIVE